MSDVYVPPSRVQFDSHCDSMKEYHRMYNESIEDPAKFWTGIADKFYWKKNPSLDNVLKYNFDVNKGPIKIEWMVDGKTNICYNALDRHLPTRENQVKYFLIILNISFEEKY